MVFVYGSPFADLCHACVKPFYAFGSGHGIVGDSLYATVAISSGLWSRKLRKR